MGCSSSCLPRYQKLLPLLGFALRAIDNSHAMVGKLSRRVFLSAARMVAHVPPVFVELLDMLSGTSSSHYARMRCRLLAMAEEMDILDQVGGDLQGTGDTPEQAGVPIFKPLNPPPPGKLHGQHLALSAGRALGGALAEVPDERSITEKLEATSLAGYHDTLSTATVGGFQVGSPKPPVQLGNSLQGHHRLNPLLSSHTCPLSLSSASQLPAATSCFCPDNLPELLQRCPSSQLYVPKCSHLSPALSSAAVHMACTASRKDAIELDLHRADQRAEALVNGPPGLRAVNNNAVVLNEDVCFIPVQEEDPGRTESTVDLDTSPLKDLLGFDALTQGDTTVFSPVRGDGRESSTYGDMVLESQKCKAKIEAEEEEALSLVMEMSRSQDALPVISQLQVEKDGDIIIMQVHLSGHVQTVRCRCLLVLTESLVTK